CLVPDEVQPVVFRVDMQERLARGQALVLANGFVIRFGLFDSPEYVDLMLLAPRLPGQFVRAEFVDGWGVPAFVAVEHDATGRGRPPVLGAPRRRRATPPRAG